MEWPVIMDRIIIWINQYGYFTIFGLLMLGIAGLPIPDELMLTFVGFLIFNGTCRPLPTLIITFLGSACGISLSYALGRSVGFHLIEKYGKIIHVSMDQINKVQRWFENIGKWTLVIGYFIPGIRHVTGFVAGTSKLEVSFFAFYAYCGAFIWSLTFLSLGYSLGKKWYKIHAYLHLIPLFIIILTIAVLLTYIIVKVHANRQRED